MKTSHLLAGLGATVLGLLFLTRKKNDLEASNNAVVPPSTEVPSTDGRVIETDPSKMKFAGLREGAADTSGLPWMPAPSGYVLDPATGLPVPAGPADKPVGWGIPFPNPYGEIPKAIDLTTAPPLLEGIVPRFVAVPTSATPSDAPRPVEWSEKSSDGVLRPTPAGRQAITAILNSYADNPRLTAKYDGASSSLIGYSYQGDPRRTTFDPDAPPSLYDLYRRAVQNDLVVLVSKTQMDAIRQGKEPPPLGKIVMDIVTPDSYALWKATDARKEAYGVGLETYRPIDVMIALYEPPTPMSSRI